MGVRVNQVKRCRSVFHGSGKSRCRGLRPSTPGGVQKVVARDGKVVCQAVQAPLVPAGGSPWARVWHNLMVV